MSNLGIASDIGNPNFAGAQNPDSVLFVRFFSAPHLNAFKSNLEGRPIMEMRDMVHIETPGNNLNIVETFAYDYHKARFPLQWAQYQNSQNGSEQIAGTMLSDWPILNSAQVEELKYFKFRTVEQVAGASDEQIKNIGMITGMSPHAFREKAKLYLKAAQDLAYVSQQDDQIKKQAEEMADLKAQMAEMKALLEAKVSVPVYVTANDEQEKRGPGRPRKVAA